MWSVNDENVAYSPTELRGVCNTAGMQNNIITQFVIKVNTDHTIFDSHTVAKSMSAFLVVTLCRLLAQFY